MPPSFGCRHCGVDASNLVHTEHGGLPAHSPNCPNRGGRIVDLTVEARVGEPFPPCWVASCRDGHPMWSGKRRTGEMSIQRRLAELDLSMHDWYVHAKGESAHGLPR